MQTECANRFRYRGWKESKQLVQTEKAMGCDAYAIDSINNNIENNRESVKSVLKTLTQTRVSEIQHIRAQVKYKSTRLF